MNRLLFVLSACFSLTFAFSAQGQRSLIMNGSFEQNGHDIPDITLESPLYWCDVNVPSGKFKAKVQDVWYTHEGEGPGLALQLRSELSSINAGDTASVSQMVYIEEDVNNISFDLQLTTFGGLPWDHNERTALVLIDGQICWDSNDLPLDSGGDFSGTIIINSDSFDQFLNNDWHEFTVAMMSNVDDSFPLDWYISRWDFIKFDKYCGGLGFLDGDLNQDCFVNLTDFADLAQVWMNEPASIRDDLYQDGIVDEYDLKLFAEDWLYNTDPTKWGQDETVQMEKLELDLDLSGEIDLGDLMVLSEYWLSDGSCAGLELAGDEVEPIVNFKDFAALVNQWGLRDWLYYYID